MKRKILQLVFHDDAPWQHYAIHEALVEDGESVPYWIGSKAIRKFDKYAIAVDTWGRMEPRSGQIDIVNASEIKELYDKVDYGDDEQELNFED